VADIPWTQSVNAIEAALLFIELINAILAYAVVDNDGSIDVVWTVVIGVLNLLSIVPMLPLLWEMCKYAPCARTDRSQVVKEHAKAACTRWKNKFAQHPVLPVTIGMAIVINFLVAIVAPAVLMEDFFVNGPKDIEHASQCAFGWDQSECISPVP
jgi:hypothetical protein